MGRSQSKARGSAGTAANAALLGAWAPVWVWWWCALHLAALYLLLAADVDAAETGGASLRGLQQNPPTASCRIPKKVTQSECVRLKDLGCPVSWVGPGCSVMCRLHSVRCSGKPKPLGDGGCQVTTNGIYCGFHCYKQCVKTRGCAWDGTKCYFPGVGR